MKRGGYLERRTPLRRIGRRALRELERLRAFRDVVLARAGGICERCGGKFSRLHAHHRRTNPRVHDPELGSALCWTCHRQIHSGAEDAAAWFSRREVKE